MISRRWITLTAIVSISLPAAAFAQGEDGATEDLDLTIRLMPEGAEEGSDITRTITLPDSVPDRVGRTVPGENAGLGDGEREERGRREDAGPPEGVDAPGLDIAEQARSGERGRELGETLRERALENREDAGRGGPPDGVPRPDTAGNGGAPDDVPRPDTPGNGGPPDDVPRPDTPGNGGPPED